MPAELALLLTRFFPGIATIVNAGRVAGMLVNDSTVEDYLDKGVRFVGIPWSPWLANGASALLDRIP